MMQPGAERSRLTAPAPLQASHDLSEFSSGRPALDDWLRTHALAGEGRTARTYVVCENGVRVVGFYAIATGSVERRVLPSRLRRVQGLPNQIPVAIIGRMACDSRYQGRGLGADLLRDGIARILTVAETIGIRCILVHAIDDEAARFYARYQFTESPIGSRTFFLPVETAAGAV